MKPGTPAEELIAQTLANALRGQLTLGPFDLMRLAAAAKEVEAGRIAGLALARWLATDPRSEVQMRNALRLFHNTHGMGAGLTKG